MKTNDYIYRQGASPETRVAVSQKNRIYSKPEGMDGWQQVGAASTFEVSESRAVEPVRGVGMGDQIAELVPGITEPMKITLNRMLMYLSNIHQTVGYKGGGAGLVRSLRHHRWPFDIKQELVLSQIAQNESDSYQGFQTLTDDASGTEFMAMLTFYEACWFDNYSSSFTSDGAQVSEDCSCQATDVIDGYSDYGVFIESGNNPFTDSPQSSFRFATSALTPKPGATA